MSDQTHKYIHAEIQRNAEQRLQAQLKIALAADRRAMLLGCALVVAAAVFVGASQSVVPVLGLAIAAALAFYAARPVSFGVVGYSPSDFEDDLADGKAWAEIRRDIYLHLAERIERNDKTLRNNGWAFSAAVVYAFINLIAAIIIEAVSP